MKAARLWEAGASLEAAFVQERCSSGRAKAPIQNLVMFAAGGLVACLTLAKMSDERNAGPLPIDRHAAKAFLAATESFAVAVAMRLLITTA